MTPDLGSTTRLKEAERKAREYRWAEAAESYRQALRSKPRSNRLAAEIWEKAGFCYNRASGQAEDLGQFKSLRQRAGEAYREAGKHFGREDDSESHGRQARCYAIAEYVNSWLASSVAEKKSTLDKCCTNGTTALEAFEEAGDEARYGETCNNLQLCLFDYLNIASSAREKQIIAQRGIDYGEKAISALAERKDKGELLVAYSLASLQNWYACMHAESRELSQRSLDYSEKALALSEKADDPYSGAMSRWAATFCSLFFRGEIESSMKYAKEMLQLGSMAGDNYLKGVALYLLAFVTELAIPGEATPDKKKERCSAIFKYAEEGIRCLKLVSQDFYVAETSKSYAESYMALAREVEVDVKKKCSLLEEAARIGRRGLEHAVLSGSPDATASTLHIQKTWKGFLTLSPNHE